MSAKEYPSSPSATAAKVPQFPRERILGLSFFKGTANEAFTELHDSEGGLLVAPSAPSLIPMTRYPKYRESLEAASIVLPDSGFMILLTRLLALSNMKRVSGLAMLRMMLAEKSFSSSKRTFWIMPSEDSERLTRRWLVNRGLAITTANTYVAPMYEMDAVKDEQLLMTIVQAHPRYIIINIAGGVQEQLGHYLMERLDYRPIIICTGAAIGFLTGEQAEISPSADRHFMGWLVRIIENPGKFLPRYLKAFKLAWLMLRFRREWPH